MSEYKSFCFCGVGGSGMMPLAILLKQSGYTVIGTDRSYDQGKNLQKFEALKNAGIEILPQDGSAITSDIDVLVVSTAIEESIPDVQSAYKRDVPIIKRGKLLATLFNKSEQRIAVAGTSGKSTVTGMIGTVLKEVDLDPTVMNGGEVINFRTSVEDKFASVRKGHEALFVAEMDESDGSIAHYTPTIGVLNNIALDHKSMDELKKLFGEYLAVCERSVVVNFDQPFVRELLDEKIHANIISFSLQDKNADLFAKNINPQKTGIDFQLVIEGQSYNVSLRVPGKHNIENVLAALGVCYAMGLDMVACTQGIEKFKGIHRRLELVGEKNDISVIDDFAHNPDKILATLKTLKEFHGRLVVMFQPHGFGPLKLMGQEMVDVFSELLDRDDVLVMSEAFYAGGTTDRDVTARDLIDKLKERGINAHWFAKREEIPEFLIPVMRSGDRIVIMGARDDTLHDFAQSILKLI